MNNRKIKLDFEKWCFENNHSEYLELWDYELNDKFPNEVSYSSNKIYYFKCPKGQHESMGKRPNTLTNSKRSLKLTCEGCNSFGTWCVETYGEKYLEMYWDYERNKVSPFKLFKSTTKKAWFKCLEKSYHSYEMSIKDFYSGNRCPYCHGARLHIEDSLGVKHPYVEKIWGSKNTKTPFQLSCGTREKVWVKCETHGEVLVALVDYLKRELRCPICSRESKDSILQKKVYNHLLKMGYKVNREYDGEVIAINPKTGCRLPYDNEICELKLIVEVNGQQHYQITGFSKKKNTTNPQKELDFQKTKDRYKKYIAWRQGYEVLEIPYWSDNKAQEWKFLLEEKIKNIEKRKRMI